MKSIEFTFQHPEYNPLQPEVCAELQRLLAMDVPDETKREALKNVNAAPYNLEYETQDLIGVPFRTKGLWHVDSKGSPHTTSLFSTSTTATTAAGLIVFHETIEPLISELIGKNFDFSNKPNSTLFHGLMVLFEQFGVQWLDVACGKIEDPAIEHIAKLVTVVELDFQQVPEYTTATSFVEKMLHKSTPRKIGEPRARVFGHHSYFR